MPVEEKDAFREKLGFKKNKAKGQKNKETKEFLDKGDQECKGARLDKRHKFYLQGQVVSLLWQSLFCLGKRQKVCFLDKRKPRWFWETFDKNVFSEAGLDQTEADHSKETTMEDLPVWDTCCRG